MNFSFDRLRSKIGRPPRPNMEAFRAELLELKRRVEANPKGGMFEMSEVDPADSEICEEDALMWRRIFSPHKLDKPVSRKEFDEYISGMRRGAVPGKSREGIATIMSKEFHLPGGNIVETPEILSFRHEMELLFQGEHPEFRARNLGTVELQAWRYLNGENPNFNVWELRRDIERSTDPSRVLFLQYFESHRK